MGDIFFGTRRKVIGTQYFVAIQQQTFAQVGTQKTGPSGHKNFFCGYHSAVVLSASGMPRPIVR